MTHFHRQRLGWSLDQPQVNVAEVSSDWEIARSHRGAEPKRLGHLSDEAELALVTGSSQTQRHDSDVHGH